MTQTSETAACGTIRHAAGGRGGKRPALSQPASRCSTARSSAELRKVIWPTRNELVTYTVVSVIVRDVMVASSACCDYVFTKLVFRLFG